MNKFLKNKHYSYEPTDIVKSIAFSKLPEEWRLLALFRERKTISMQENNVTYSIEDKIVDQAKITLKKKVELKDIDILEKEVIEFFFHEKARVSPPPPKSLVSLLATPILGPLTGETYFDYSDIKEVYSVTKNYDFTKSICGSMLSKKCGWISWLIIKGDNYFMKSLTEEFITLISWNMHSHKKSLEDVFIKSGKFASEVSKRNFKRFFVGSTFWFHEDLNRFINEMKSKD
jgi:hypothetical protein